MIILETFARQSDSIRRQSMLYFDYSINFHYLCTDLLTIRRSESSHFDAQSDSDSAFVCLTSRYNICVLLSCSSSASEGLSNIPSV